MEAKNIVEIKNFTLRYRVQQRIGYYIKFNDTEQHSIYISLSELLKLFIIEGLSMEDVITLWEENRSITFEKAILYINIDYINGELCVCAGSDVTAVYLEKVQIPYLHEVDAETINKIKKKLHRFF